MVEKNFFKLKLTHPVVIHFAEDHYQCITANQEGYDFLEAIESKEPMDEAEQMEMLINFYRGISKHYSELQESYHNFIISYFAFKETAKTNEMVKEEFNKLPADFAPVKEHFEKLIDAYEITINNMKRKI
ncbi:MAG: hypothetical protein WCP52_10975 [Bacteroidota bacterium]